MENFNANIKQYRKNLYRNIKQNRVELNLTQKQVAIKMDISYQAYQAYECGRSLPTLENLIKLCEIFDVTPNELLDYK